MTALLAFDLDKLARHPQLVGVDEAGRGALAGPVIAAAVLVTREFLDSAWVARRGHLVNDSKQIPEGLRETLGVELRDLVQERILFASTAGATVLEIEAHNVLGATRLAMQRALERLLAMGGGLSSLTPMPSGDSFFENPPPSSGPPVLIDGTPLRPFPYAHEAIPGGDGRSFSIALASIMAKTCRDHLLASYHVVWPDYGFQNHKGYGTPEHLRHLERIGPCPEHRPSFLRRLSLGKPDRVLNQLFLHPTEPPEPSAD